VRFRPQTAGPERVDRGSARPPANVQGLGGGRLARRVDYTSPVAEERREDHHDDGRPDRVDRQAGARVDRRRFRPLPRPALAAPLRRPTTAHESP